MLFKKRRVSRAGQGRLAGVTKLIKPDKNIAKIKSPSNKI